MASTLLVTIWFFLEAFFLLYGVIALIHIMTAEIQTEGYGKLNRYFIAIGLLIIMGFALLLTLFLNQASPGNSDQVSLFGINLFVPALSIIRDVSFGIIAVGIIYIVLWAGKDRRSGVVSSHREAKKAVIAWILILTFIVMILRIIPVAIGAAGSLKQLSNILDLFGLFFALGLGIARVLQIRDAPLRTKPRRRLHPQRLIDWFPVYSRILFLFSIGITIFYRILQGNTIGGITGDPDPFKIEQK